MGHYCRICGRTRANEKFSGKGHRNHLCKDCQKIPKRKRRDLQTIDDLYAFIRQQRISKKNRTFMTGLLEHEDDFIRELAKAILKIARISQDKRRRWRKILAEDPDFFQLCDELDLVPDYFRESEEYVMRDPLPGEEMLPDHAFFPEDSDDDFPISEFFVDEDRYWELTPFQKRWKGDQFEDVGGCPF